MANYPGSLYAPSSIVDGTVLAALLLTEPYDELDAVEQELGLNVHGLSGSVADRLNLFMDQDGQTPYVKLADAGVNERKRMRSGINSISSDDLDSLGVGTIVWSPPLSKMRGGHIYIVFLTLQVTDEDIAAPEAAAQISWVGGEETTTDTSFQFVVKNGLGDGTTAAGRPTSGSFLVHWMIVEKLFSGESETDLDDNAEGSRDNGGHAPGPSGKVGLENGDWTLTPTDFLLQENGDFVLFEGFSSAVSPVPANFLLTEAGDNLIHERTLPATDTHRIAQE